MPSLYWTESLNQQQTEPISMVCTHLPLVDVHMDSSLFPGDACCHGSADQQIWQTISVQINSTHTGAEIRSQLHKHTQRHTRKVINITLFRMEDANAKWLLTSFPDTSETTCSMFLSTEKMKTCTSKTHALTKHNTQYQQLIDRQVDSYTATLPFWLYCGAPPTTSTVTGLRKWPAPTE